MKKIYIHVGPPKTGSSAIQKFLLDHRKELLNRGILYPEHPVDANGISSGHGILLYKKRQEERDELRLEKLGEMVSAFQKGPVETLVLSSEAFWMDAAAIRKTVPEAVFIYYLRDPFEIIESQYNQTVKRQNNTHKFKPDASVFVTDVLLERYFERYGTDNIRIRLYDRLFLKDGNLADDFLSVIGAGSLVAVPAKKINPSYSLEALEIKRSLNQLELPNRVNTRLDRILQKHTGTSGFSLVDPESYLDFKNKVIERFEKLSEQYPIPELAQFKKYLSAKDPRPFRQQQISAEQALSVVKFIRQQDRGLFNYLARQILLKRLKGSGSDAFESLYEKSSMGSFFSTLFFRLRYRLKSFR